MNPNSPKLMPPSHSEWGVLNSLKQKEYQQTVKLQKILELQKKQYFRSQLQKQLRMKEHNSMFQKSQDKQYYEFITNKVHNQENKQKEYKQQKYFTRKSVDWQNRKKQIEERDLMRSSRFKSDQNTNQQRYLIGFRDESAIKAHQQIRKQRVINGLAQQVRQKQINKRQNRIKQIEDFQKDIEYQNHLERSKKSNNDRFKQNDKVYQYYSSLYQQKQQQSKNLEYSLVEKPNLTKMQSQQLFEKKKAYEQQIRKQYIKDALDHQVNQHMTQKRIEKQPRPEQISYSFFGNMFDPNSKGYGKYDKKQYNQYLQRQMSQQRQNKKRLQYMDQQEYLYNLNQINKAVNGSYLNKSYQDFSIANVGQKLNSDSKKLHMIMKQNKNYQHIENPESAYQNKRNQQNDDQKLIRNNLQGLLKNHIKSRKSSSQVK